MVGMNDHQISCLVLSGKYGSSSHSHTSCNLGRHDDVEETATLNHTQNSAASSCSSRLSHLPTGGEDEEDPTTLIRVWAQQHPPVTYLMGPNSLLKHVLRNYCTRNSLLYESKRFLYNGNRVRQNHTPAGLGMEDGDAIDAMSHMLGGGAAVT
ncbi:small ubiquitin-related modifier 2-like [Prunus avium]|uniref:Small ubiquitin-related modifier 2-like n=1 Tax=Prunus avium TaxID=42229 RepID=A0A6P5RCU6_PRUAV|nr:small ubiquitin-related modifier 2-like [Prunus avium]